MSAIEASGCVGHAYFQDWKECKICNPPSATQPAGKPDATFAQLVYERDQLRDELKELRHSSLREVVSRFHRKFGQSIATVPHVPDKKVVQFRLKLIAEEFFELLAACGLTPTINGSDCYASARNIVTDSIDEEFAGEVNLPEFVDALCDLEFVIEGTRLTFGVDGAPILAEVERANMSKDVLYVQHKNEYHLEGLRTVAKPVKPEGWKPPDIEGELAKQGWEADLSRSERR
jgi:predicted HAD superfamily Cof-like phosphohydrolase